MCFRWIGVIDVDVELNVTATAQAIVWLSVRGAGYAIPVGCLIGALIRLVEAVTARVIRAVGGYVCCIDNTELRMCAIVVTFRGNASMFLGTDWLSRAFSAMNGVAQPLRIFENILQHGLCTHPVTRCALSYLLGRYYGLVTRWSGDHLRCGIIYIVCNTVPTYCKYIDSPMITKGK